MDYAFPVYAALEQELESLGHRWTAICKWSEDRWVALHDVMAKWQAFDERQLRFNTWLTETEAVLVGLQSVNMSDISQVVQQVQCIKVSRFDKLIN